MNAERYVNHTIGQQPIALLQLESMPNLRQEKYTPCTACPDRSFDETLSLKTLACSWQSFSIMAITVQILKCNVQVRKQTNY